MDTFIYQNRVLSKNECNLIIDFFNDNQKSHLYGNVAGGKFIPEIKLSTDINLKFFNEDGKYNNSISELISEKLKVCVNEYKQRYSVLNEISEWNLFNHYNIQRYYPTEGYFAPHAENDGESYNIRRVLVWMIYLNSLNFGGGTRFPYFNKTIKAEEGKVVIWPAYWNHLHHGIVHKSKTKYIATGWFSFDEL